MAPWPGNVKEMKERPMFLPREIKAKRMATRSVCGIAIATLAAMAAACSGAASSGSANTPAGTGKVDTAGEITIGTPNPPDGLNPGTTDNVGAGFPFLEAVYGQLIQVNPTSGNFEPDLATAWAWSASHLALTLTLRKGVTFQDGTPFNAAAVAYYENYYIKQGDTNGLLSLVKSVVATGPYTVVFNLAGLDSTLIGNLTTGPGFVPSEAALKSDPAGLDTHPIGAGPYKFVSQETGYDYVFQRWPTYWDNASLPRVQQLRWEVFPTDTAEVDAIKSGAINVATFLDPQDAKALNGYPGLTVSEAADVDAWFGWEDTADAPFNSAQFRLAWEEAIDRNGLADVVTDGTGRAFTVASPGVEPYVENLLPIWPYDPAGAAKLVKESGYRNGLNVTCYAEAQDLGGNYNAIDPILIADYKAAGINLTIRPMDAAQLGLMVQGKLGACAFGNSDAVDTSIWGILNTYKNTVWSQGVFDPSHVDYGTDQYIDAFQGTFTNAGLEKLYYDIEKQQKSVPGVLTPLFTAPEVNVYQSGIKGWQSNAFNNDYWYAMYRTS
jgi:ABC-type transport system substrate-binding protein